MDRPGRDTLFPPIAAHIERLATTHDEIAEPHRTAGQRLAEWVGAQHRHREALPIVVVCTGNSRRSILGAMMGNAIASFLGRPELRFFSAGTTPSAFNSRTIQALRSIGFEVDATGEDAAPGPEGLVNPRYLVRWGTDPAQQMLEFSKALGDPALPRGGFAAVMVCDEADAGCPIVPGAAIRIAVPFPDPKSADDTPRERDRYAATRDDMGRFLFAALDLAADRITIR